MSILDHIAPARRATTAHHPHEADQQQRVTVTPVLDASTARVDTQQPEPSAWQVSADLPPGLRMAALTAVPELLPPCIRSVSKDEAAELIAEGSRRLGYVGLRERADQVADVNRQTIGPDGVIGTREAWAERARVWGGQETERRATAVYWEFRTAQQEALAEARTGDDLAEQRQQSVTPAATRTAGTGLTDQERALLADQVNDLNTQLADMTRNTTDRLNRLATTLDTDEQQLAQVTTAPDLDDTPARMNVLAREVDEDAWDL